MGLLVRKCVAFAVSIALLFTSMPASAFKIDTHMWIAQQIINDLSNQDGMLTIQVGESERTFEVNEEVRNAILNYPQLYLLGSIGPDAFPGIYEGQMAIHPGRAEGWGTGDWLEYVVSQAESEEEVAFAYGMLAHAASDIWAHTYVNQYAGDAYSLTDGEVDVETRHFLLESYIAKRMPKGVLPDGQEIERYSDLLRVDGELAVPVEFLFRIFVEDERAADEFSEAAAPHFRSVRDLNKALAHIARDGGPTDQIHEFIQEDLVAAQAGIVLSDEQWDKVREWHQKFLNAEGQAIEDLIQAFEGLSKIPNDLSSSEEAAFDNALANLKGLRAEIGKLEGQKDDAEDKIIDLLKSIESLKPKCRTVGILIKVTVCDPKSPALIALEKILTEKRNIRDGIGDDLDSKLKQARKLVEDSYQFLRDKRDTERAILVAIVEFAQRFKENENPIKSALLAWKRDNEEAMKSYFLANGQAMANSLDGDSMMDPLTRWLKCEALVFTSLASEILDPACKVSDRIGEFKRLLAEFKKLDPVSAEVDRIVEDIREQVLAEATDEGLSFASHLTGAAIDDFVKAVSENVSRERLNEQFSKAPAGVPLLLIPNMAEHADFDMKLSAEGDFSAREFPPIANAITLTKLSLASPAQLNSLIGERRYSSTSKGYGNVMYRFASSIDGNHQWLPTPPPYPRADANHKTPEDEQTPVDKSYGYSSAFPLWQDLRIRDDIFRSLFKGPLNGGFSDGSRPFPMVEIAEYDYNPTPECAFPAYSAETGDDGCRTKRSWLQRLLEALGLR